MTPTTPDKTKFLLPDAGVRDVNYLGPEGTDIMPLPTLVTEDDGRVISQWQPSAGELELLKLGVPVTIVMHSAGVVAPIAVGVGGFDLR